MYFENLRGHGRDPLVRIRPGRPLEEILSAVQALPADLLVVGATRRRGFQKLFGGRLVDKYVCLGDLVGYGANPNACIEGVRGLPQVEVVLGHHDAAATWVTSPYEMNTRAREAIMFF